MSLHSSDWVNIIVSGTSAIASMAAAFAAFLSLKSTNQTLKNQIDAFQFDREKHLLELIKHDALEANKSINGRQSNDWNFEQALDINKSMHSVRNRILESYSSFPLEKIIHFKNYFKDQLSSHITAELNNIDPPDVAYKPLGPIHVSYEAVEAWNYGKAFFDYPRQMK